MYVIIIKDNIITNNLLYISKIHVFHNIINQVDRRGTGIRDI
jgi:hypothetical protein